MNGALAFVDALVLMLATWLVLFSIIMLYRTIFQERVDRATSSANSILVYLFSATLSVGAVLFALGVMLVFSIRTSE